MEEGADVRWSLRSRSRRKGRRAPGAAVGAVSRRAVAGRRMGGPRPARRREGQGRSRPARRQRLPLRVLPMESQPDRRRRLVGTRLRGVRYVAPIAWRSSRAALVVAAAVFSHWPLDLVVHQSDMPLVGNAGKVGLDLWSSAPATYLVEMLIVAAGLALYLRVTEATSTFGRVAPWVLALLLVAVGYSTVFGDSSDVKSAAAVSLVTTVLVLPGLAWLVELRRRPRATRQAPATP